MAYTKEQQKAIILDSNNILINAGAGSGKTTVLTQRIINKLLKGTKISELLVLTFTNAAAKEMKERIIAAVKEEESLKEELPFVYISDIMTFDSFLLKLIKMYGYIVNVGNDIKIGDDILLEKTLLNVIEEVFYEYYTLMGDDFTSEEIQKSAFFKLFNNYTVFNYDSLIKVFKTLYYSYEKILDKNIIFENVEENFVKQTFSEYENIIFNKIKNIKLGLSKLRNLEVDEKTEKKISKYVDAFNVIINAIDYDELVFEMENFRAPNKIKSEDFLKLEEVCLEIKGEYDLLKSILIAQTKVEIIAKEEQKKDLKLLIIEMLQKIDAKYMEKKKELKVLSFSDINVLIIEILQSNASIKEQIRNQYKEILVDEYQDTNDFQNLLINLISKDNLYLVGDVKQSIYGFRNANPTNFVLLEDKFKKDEKSEVITLAHNFRSREEVLLSVNKVFEKLMTQEIGMINYVDNHALLYGNKTYDKKIQDHDYMMKQLQYNLEEIKEVDNFDKDLLEPLIIAHDIKQKIEDGFEVLKGGKLEQVGYGDFAILTKNKNKYDSFKKVFEYMQIPFSSQKEEVLNDRENIEIITFISVLKLLLKIEDAALVSVMRSFLYTLEEQKIYDYIKNKVMCSEIEEVLEKIEYIKSLNIKNMNLLLHIIYKEFEFFKKMVKLKEVSNINERFIKVEEVVANFSNIWELIEYLEYAFVISENKIALEVAEDMRNNVKLMTIHKSKGLEFPIVYIANMDVSLVRAKSDLIYMEDEVLIVPKVENYVKEETYLKTLKVNENIMSNINENIRVLYVAMTRAKEQVIFVGSQKVKELNLDAISSIKKFSDLVHLISNDMYKEIVELNKVYEEDFNNIKNFKLQKVNKISKDNVQSEFEYKKIEDKLGFINLAVSSFQIQSVVSKKDKESITLGINIHNRLEKFDFNKLNKAEYINEFIVNSENTIRESISNIINNFKKYTLFQNMEYFKTEYEFYYEDEDKSVNGIIDLLVKTQDFVYIIDYKLKDISKLAYEKQLNTYKKAMEGYYNIPIKCFLYSLLDDEIKEV